MSVGDLYHACSLAAELSWCANQSAGYDQGSARGLVWRLEYDLIGLNALSPRRAKDSYRATNMHELETHSIIKYLAVQS